MFTEVDQTTGLPEREENSHCVFRVDEMVARGFTVIETTRTICCTEIHRNGPFKIRFTDGHVIVADAISSDYAGVSSTHRIVLYGCIPAPGDKVAFEAIAL